jgi:23S rRNA (cytosine1962-C5)-methyltransferase
VDRYGDHLVVQTLTLAMDMRKDLLTQALVEILKPTSIVERNDSSVRLAEKLEQVTGMLHGESPEPFRVGSRGISFLVDLRAGQKTGLYLDQLDNYAQVAPLTKGKTVLDCFTNQGGFAIASALAGATQVDAIDISDEAVAAAKANAEASGVGDKVNAFAGNVFDFLKDAENKEKRWDVIILDPPSFTKSKKTLGDALRGYKEIHLRALKLLSPGGLLATYCCSHHVSLSDFRRVICEAAVDAKRTLRTLAYCPQRMDHPVLPQVPETEYLKGYIYEIIGGF